MAGILDPSGSVQRRPVETQRFMVVIPIGYGENLYPLNQGANVTCKALMPVGNVPIINHVLNWVFASGLTDILILVPPSFHSAISNHLLENYTEATHPRARITLKKHTEGEKDEEDLISESASGETKKTRGDMRKEGTARLLRRFRNWITSDFVMVPCDVFPPRDLTLASILSKHLANSRAVLTSVMYEPAQAVKESEEKVLSVFDKSTNQLLLLQSVEALEEEMDVRMSLLASHPNVTFTTRYLDSHIYVFRKTVLDLLNTRRPKDLDSIREQVVPWLVKGSWQRGLRESWSTILDPPRRNFLAKALAMSTTAPPGITFSPLSPPDSPAADERRSTVSKPSSPDSAQSSSATVPSLPKLTSAALNASSGSRSDYQSWMCQVVLVEPEALPEPVVPEKPTKGGGGGKDKSRAAAAPPPEPDHLIRINSLTGYWELNRRLIKHLSSLPPAVRTTSVAGEKHFSASTSDDPSSTGGALAASAQISPDSVVGEGTQVGDRASIKKSIVGRHCHLARGVRLTNCIVWDFVNLGENAKLENCILGSHVRIGSSMAVTNCELGPGFEAEGGGQLKNERLIAGQEA